MAEEDLKEPEAKEPEVTEEKQSPKDALKDDLHDTTKDLIQEALESATDKQKHWYQRGISYLIAIVLVILVYVGEEFGGTLVQKIVEVLTQLTQ